MLTCTHTTSLWRCCKPLLEVARMVLRNICCGAQFISDRDSSGSRHFTHLQAEVMLGNCVGHRAPPSSARLPAVSVNVQTKHLSAGRRARAEQPRHGLRAVPAAADALRDSHGREADAERLGPPLPAHKAPHLQKQPDVNVACSSLHGCPTTVPITYP